MIPPLSGGYLPEGIHRATTQEIVERFVDPFLPVGISAATWRDVVPLTNPTFARLRLFLGWQLWNAELRNILGRDPVMEWIGGSFVSDKASPNDLDVAIWVDGLDWDSRSSRVRAKYHDLATGSSYRYGCHGYVLAVVRKGHPEYQGYLEARDEWIARYSSVRDGATKRGFLQVAGPDVAKGDRYPESTPPG